MFKRGLENKVLSSALALGALTSVANAAPMPSTINLRWSGSGAGTTRVVLGLSSSASDGLDSLDKGYIDSGQGIPTQSNVFQIYTLVNGIAPGAGVQPIGINGAASVDYKPFSTTGWDLYLGVLGNLSDSTNSFTYKIESTGLEGKEFFFYNTLTPSNRIPLNTDGLSHSISGLPAVTASNNGQYAHYRIDVVPEPTGLGLVALGAGALLSRRRKN
jgi:hypothetical protein